MTDKQNISNRLSEIEDDIAKLKNIIYALKVTDTTNYPQIYEELSIDAAFRMEQLACSLRNIIYAANIVPKQVIMDKAAKAHGITIHLSDDMVEIALPGLIPKRSKGRNSAFLTDPLHSFLDQYTKEQKLPRFTECVVCFSHVYNRELSIRRIRDYDNQECKQLLDTVAAFLLLDDSGLLCDAYHTTEFSDHDYTLLTIMSKSYFPYWLSAKEERRQSISDF